MWSVRCISLLVVGWFGVGHAQNGYETFDTVFGSRYKLYTARQDWESAFDTCEQDGAHLVVINSVEEASVVKNLFSRIPGRDPNFLFIGMTDMDHEGDWQTVFGTPLSSTGYNNWGFGEPNNAATGGEQCGTVDRNAAFNDLSCHETAPFICERPVRRSRVPPFSRITPDEDVADES